MQNPHEILGIDKGSSLNEIKRAFKKLALKYHPDKLAQKKNDDDGSNSKEQTSHKSPEKHFKDIVLAYETLIKKESSAIRTSGEEDTGFEVPVHRSQGSSSAFGTYDYEFFQDEFYEGQEEEHFRDTPSSSRQNGFSDFYYDPFEVFNDVFNDVENIIFDMHRTLSNFSGIPRFHGFQTQVRSQWNSMSGYAQQNHFGRMWSKNYFDTSCYQEEEEDDFSSFRRIPINEGFESNDSETESLDESHGFNAA